MPNSTFSTEVRAIPFRFSPFKQPTMLSAPKQALYLFIIGCSVIPVSSFGIFESSTLPLSLSPLILDSFPTQPPLQLEFQHICNSEIPLHFNSNFHLVASIPEINQSKNGNGVGQVLSEYNLLLRERPYFTKILTGACNLLLRSR